MHIYASANYAIISSDSGLSPGWRQAIIWTRAVLLSIQYFSEISIEVQIFTFSKMHLEMLAILPQWAIK